MLDFGFSEILLTSAIALVVLGPERLPKVARQVGNWMGRARLMARQLSEQLEREVNAEELLRQQSKPPLQPDVPALTTPALAAPASAPRYPLPTPDAAAPAASVHEVSSGETGATGHGGEPPPTTSTPTPDHPHTIAQ
jgi:sec-independent protein translocase protein TatB